MKDNYQSQLFSKLVSTMITALDNPFYFGEEISNYDELASALNKQGFKNSRGRVFKGDTMSDIDRENMKDRYLPHRPFIDDEYPVMNYWNEYSARFNWGSRNDV